MGMNNSYDLFPSNGHNNKNGNGYTNGSSARSFGAPSTLGNQQRSSADSNAPREKEESPAKTGPLNSEQRSPVQPKTGSLRLEGDGHTTSQPELTALNTAASAPRPKPGSKVLSGALSAFSTSSLLSLLNIQKQTGWLRLSNGSIDGYIYVDRGEVYDAGIGTMSNGPLAAFQLFGLKQGEFSFEVGAPPPEKRTIEASLPILQVRATLWLDNMNKYSAIIPSPNHRISIAAEPRSEVVIEPYQWAVLTKIVSNSLSVAELAARLGQDLLTVTRVTAELVKMGVAEVHPPEEL
ncbi:MAG TPA: DUF4388 domain-containing protein [Chloroflexia bacterium]|nr:DUF4388 domain-containing protein [Chloroflexia bacterium]